jgi:hypothetical protein
MSLRESRTLEAVTFHAIDSGLYVVRWNGRKIGTVRRTYTRGRLWQHRSSPEDPFTGRAHTRRAAASELVEQWKAKP